MITQLVIIGNIRCFIKFQIAAELPQVKVPKKHLHGTLFSLQTLIKTTWKDLQTHSAQLQPSCTLEKIQLVPQLCVMTFPTLALHHVLLLKSITEVCETILYNCFSGNLVNPANITAFITKANKEIPLGLRKYVGQSMAWACFIWKMTQDE